MARGSVFDEKGNETTHVEGLDTYRFVLDNQFVLHETDVHVGDEHVLAMEFIGGAEAKSGPIPMRAFDAKGSLESMTLAPLEDGALRASTEGMRSTLRPAADGKGMTALWEREATPGQWVKWMDMHFTRLA